MKRLHSAFILLILFLSTTAQAQISVQGRLFSPSHCNYYYTTLADFILNYNSSSSQPTKSVRFIVGFHNTWGNKDLADLRTVDAQKLSPTEFEANLNEVVVNERGRFVFDKIQIVAEIENQDGSKIWYRPGLERSSFFQAALPQNASCAGREGTPFENLKIEGL